MQRDHLNWICLFSRFPLFFSFFQNCDCDQQGFAPQTAFFKPQLATSTTELEACRTNAKKQKIKRNRENMRKFSSPGKKGTSRRKTLKKLQSSAARQRENEFIAKCFITTAPPNADE